MKTKKILSVALVSATMLFASCSENDSNNSNYRFELPETLTDEVIANYVDNTVLAAYSELKSRVQTMKEKIDAIDQNDAASIAEASKAWRSARQPWELSESFLQGPATDLELDPNMDDWPLDKNVIDQLMTGTSFNPEIIGNATNTQGFHTMEYLLFSNGKPKTSLTDKELSYLKIVAKLMAEHSTALYEAWNENYENTDGVAYGDIYKQHNSEKFPSQVAVLREIIETGMMDICNEVGTQKIANPVREYQAAKTDAAKEHAQLQVESWYSYNSLNDFANNIRGIKDVYFGGCTAKGTSNESKGLTALVKTITDKDGNNIGQALDQEIRNQIDATINAIFGGTVDFDGTVDDSKNNGIPFPFREHLGVENNAKINNASEQCNKLYDLLQTLEAKLSLN